jgi:stage II sporulation protein D
MTSKKRRQYELDVLRKASHDEQVRFFRIARISPFLLTLLSLGAFASVIPFQQNSRIRVRLSEGTASAKIRGLDLRFYQNVPGRGPALIDANNQSEWDLRCEGGRIRAKRMDTLAGKIGFQSVDLPEPVTIRSPAGFISFGGKPYREELHVHSVGSLCEVVNEVDLEKYLEGLVNAEFSSKWNEQAIGAQVVAARTYALYQMRQATIQDLNYDVDGSTHDQVYDGSIREDASAARVVERTRGLVLTTGSGMSMIPLKAFYHSTCGGETELPEKVWGSASAGFHHSVRCPFCANSPSAHWSLNLSSWQLTELLKSRYKTPPGRLRGIQISGFDSSGRVTDVLVYFTGSTKSLKISATQFRDLIGTTRFKSTAFVIQTDIGSSEPSFRFAGRGNGHGVGMCQWGAKVMGERGYSTASILKFYYPDAILRKLW